MDTINERTNGRATFPVAAGVGGRADAQGYSAADNVRQKFTGYERDGETTLDFAQARYYSNKSGRLTSTDPLLASAKPANPQTWNRYTYALNNPLAYADPSGLELTWIQRKDSEGNLLETKRIDSADRKNYSSNDGWSDVTYDSNGEFSYAAVAGGGQTRTALLTPDGKWRWGEAVTAGADPVSDEGRQNPLGGVSPVSPNGADFI
jgi:RHS repeat-associated protein